eukprot:NODE_1031_length_1921_cov_0.298024.p1 type:complete len:380 gc:universal NODE_1031_length_1921_cov_0.298024:352-1491(+)
MKVELLSSCSTTRARTMRMDDILLPQFMPVGTKGSIKGMTSKQLHELRCQTILGNTFHLGLDPGTVVFDEFDGLHNFMQFSTHLLTDSGGFQMVSLKELCTVTEHGVEFVYNGTKTMLTPEKSIEWQNKIGANIIMQLDDVVDPTSSDERIEEAVYRSVRWLDRCIAAHANPGKQSLFPIVQGGLNYKHREFSINEIIKRNTDGIAIGGLAGKESKNDFWKVVHFCTGLLPRNKPIYCMGIGYVEDLIVCVALGVDMFDCVYPTRTARFGRVLLDEGPLNIRNAIHKMDFRAIDATCTCYTCKTYSRSELNLMFGSTNTARLLTIHNIHYHMHLMDRIRSAINNDEFPIFVKKYMKTRYKNSCPQWIKDAMLAVGVEIE